MANEQDLSVMIVKFWLYSTLQEKRYQISCEKLVFDPADVFETQILYS